MLTFNVFGEGNCAMGAGRYVGRVGGLAVALGIGTAVFTGHGVASATTDSDASPTHAETDSGQTTHRSPARGPAVEAKADDAEGTVAKRPLTRPDTPRQTTAGGRHRLAPGSKTPSSPPVTAQSNSGSAPATHRGGSGVPTHAVDKTHRREAAAEPHDRAGRLHSRQDNLGQSGHRDRRARRPELQIR